MKKLMLMLLLLLLVGCNEQVNDPVKESLNSIDNAKYTAAKQTTIQLIKSAEIKYMNDAMYGGEKDCYTFDEINVSSAMTGGKVCYENNEYVAHDILIDGYICSGTISTINCEEIK